LKRQNEAGSSGVRNPYPY